MENRCYICGSIVPEGTEICLRCYKKWMSDEEEDTQTKTSIKKENEKKEKRGDRRIVIH